jgi:hypothetical protein
MGSRYLSNADADDAIGLYSPLAPEVGQANLKRKEQWQRELVSCTAPRGNQRRFERGIPALAERGVTSPKGLAEGVLALEQPCCGSLARARLHMGFPGKGKR